MGTVRVINVSERRRVLTFWEKIYLPEIWRGLVLTARHFSGMSNGMRFVSAIAAEEVDDPNIEKRPKVFDIDIGRCVFCGFCVEACPEDAIRMDTGITEIGALSREGMVLNIDTLLSLPPKSERGDKPVDFLQQQLVQ
ncbi:MAG: 4Fe-4S binding protein [candidate division Zixibacteria bacterium]|nr:4Fe-4S binding protein [candidate division Zixibacteria bacterium]